ncbi:MAG: tyrosine-type recombinase/integrase [Gemmataceae bacterium]
MASLVRPSVTEYRLNGKRVKKSTPGAVKRRTRASKWYGQGLPHLPPKKRVPLSPNRQVAQRMLDDMVRAAERGRVGLPDLDAGRKSLADHLTGFDRDLRLGLASRTRTTRRTPDAGQVALCVQRVRDTLNGCGFRTPADLSDAAPAKLATYLGGRVALARRDGGISAQTAKFYLAAVTRFTWWLAVRAKAPVRADLFADVPSYDGRADRKHARRELHPEEMARLLDATRTSPIVIRELTGEARYFLYLVAFSSGYRAGELAELTPECFALDADTPTVSLPPKLTKNKKAAAQPIPAGVAAQLRGFLAGTPEGRPVWPGTWREKPAKVLRRDLSAAGIPYSVPSPAGPLFADFHSLRHSYLSALAAAGVGLKELMELARHSDPKLTMGVYVHARPAALGAAVERIALPAGDQQRASGLSALSRDAIEDLVMGLAGALSVLTGQAELFAPRLAPSSDPAGESGRRVGPERPRTASA